MRGVWEMRIGLSCGCSQILWARGNGYFPHDLTPEPSEDDEYTWRHFTGWQVVDAVAGAIGEIEHVEDSTANTIFFVGDKLIPATEDFIERIDAKERTIYMILPEGLLDL